MGQSVPELFERLRAGDRSALNDLVAALYEELHRIAGLRLRGERPGHTLQPTALVHEAYLKLFDRGDSRFSDQAHFLAVASRVMRQVLVDYARARSAFKRSGGENASWPAPLQVEGGAGADLVDLIELDVALDELAAEHETLERLVEMRYFGGMTAEEIATALDLSVHIVRHDVRLAQAWLRRKLSKHSA